MAPNKKKTASFRLDDHILKNLKHLGVDLERSTSSLLREAILDMLKKYEKPKPKPKKERRPYLELARNK